MMKAGMNNDETSSPMPMNNTRDERINTPTIDFDDWAEDPFTTLAKESDVFASFATEDEISTTNAVNNSNFNSNSNNHPASSSFPFIPHALSASSIISGNNSSINNEKNVINAVNDTTTSNTSAASRKRSHFQQSQQKQTSNSSSSNKSTTTSSTKKKSDYIPISRRKKKPKGMPKRPLSAYNLYFQAQRTTILAVQNAGNGPRIGFEGLGKIIGKKWRDLSSIDKREYDKLAEKDSERYRKEMDTYHEMKAKRYEEEEKRAVSETKALSNMATSARDVSSIGQVSSSFGGGVNYNTKQQMQGGSIKVIPVGDGFVNSHLFTHPSHQGSHLVSSISSSFPPGTQPGNISYRPVSMARVEQLQQQPPSPHYASQHQQQQHNVMDVNTNGGHNIHPRGPSPSQHFTQHMVDRSADPASYNNDVGPGSATSSAAAPRNNNCQMPPGMEVVLSDRNGVDRKYRVQYTCYSMTRENANKYIDSLTGNQPQQQSSAAQQMPMSMPPPAATGPSNGGYADWGP
jgi:hypothetical protein